MPLVSFSSGQVISSANVNANFGLCVLTDTSRTITVTHTYTAVQTLTGGWTAAAACTISSGGIAVTGNSTITGTLGGVVSLTMTAAATKIVPGATSLSLRNNADSNDNILITDAGIVTLRHQLNVTGNNGIKFGAADTGFSISGAELYLGDYASANKGIRIDYTNGAVRTTHGLTVPGTLTLTATASKLVPGATSFSHRNNADGLDNLLITDAGAVTARASLAAPTVTTSSGSISAWTQFEIQGTKVVSTRVTGYTNAWTGTAANRATSYDAASITTAQLAARVRALQNDMEAHGLIGV